MKRLSLLVFVPVLARSVAAAAPSLEAVKASDLVASWGAVHADLVAAPQSVEGAPAAAPDASPAASPTGDFAERYGYGPQRRSYIKRGYTFESEAQSARSAAEAGLRSAGMAVLVSNVVRDYGYPYQYSFRIEYLEQESDPYTPLRALETYKSGADFNFDSEARPQMDSTIYNFQAAGYQVVLGEVRRENAYPYRYFYQIDYFKPAYPSYPQPSPGQEFKSGHYRDRYSAQVDMDNFVARFRQQGRRIVSAEILEQGGWFMFRIFYR